jgi:hypothetical protein
VVWYYEKWDTHCQYEWGVSESACEFEWVDNTQRNENMIIAKRNHDQQVRARKGNAGKGRAGKDTSEGKSAANLNLKITVFLNASFAIACFNDAALEPEDGGEIGVGDAA